MANQTPEQLQLLIMRGHIASLDEADRLEVMACAEQLRAVIAPFNARESGLGDIAVALVACEFAAS